MSTDYLDCMVAIILGNFGCVCFNFKKNNYETKIFYIIKKVKNKFFEKTTLFNFY